MLGVRATTTSFDERMSNIEFHTNDVKGTGACSEGVASSRCPVDQQRRPGRHPATAEQRQKRLRWSKEDNKRLFECYIRSKPERRGYRKRLLALWKARNINNDVGQGKNSFDTKGHSEGCPCQQRPPYCLPNHDVEAPERSYG